MTFRRWVPVTGTQTHTETFYGGEEEEIALEGDDGTLSRSGVVSIAGIERGTWRATIN